MSGSDDMFAICAHTVCLFLSKLAFYFYMIQVSGWKDFFCQYLLHGGHVDSRDVGIGILVAPESSDGLGRGVEADSRLAVEVDISTDRATGAGEREHGQWDRDGDVDTDLASINLVGELSGSRTALGEDGSAVTVLVLVGDLDGLVQGGGVQADKNRSKDLLAVALHVGGDVGQDAGSNEVALLVLLDLQAASIQNQIGTLFNTGCDQALNTLEGLGRDQRTEVSIGLKAGGNLELLSTLNKLGQPLLGLANKHDGGKSHAALTSGTKGGTGKLVQGVVLVGVGHNDSVVFGAQVGL